MHVLRALLSLRQQHRYCGHCRHCPQHAEKTTSNLCNASITCVAGVSTCNASNACIARIAFAQVVTLPHSVMVAPHPATGVDGIASTAGNAINAGITWTHVSTRPLAKNGIAVIAGIASFAGIGRRFRWDLQLAGARMGPAANQPPDQRRRTVPLATPEKPTRIMTGTATRMPSALPSTVKVRRLRRSVSS